MALKVKQNLVKENIEDENGNILGELKFNPNDSRIMTKLSKIAKNVSDAISKLNSLKADVELTNIDINNTDDFEKTSKSFDKIYNLLNIEENTIDEIINDLSDVFGKDTIEIFTGGSKDISTLMPLLDFIIPYVQEARNQKVSKYIKDENGDQEVMEQMNILTSPLPKKIKIENEIYDINYDYRSIINILLAFEDQELTYEEKIIIMLHK